MHSIGTATVINLKTKIYQPDVIIIIFNSRDFFLGPTCFTCVYTCTPITATVNCLNTQIAPTVVVVKHQIIVPSYTPPTYHNSQVKHNMCTNTNTVIL